MGFMTFYLKVFRIIIVILILTILYRNLKPEKKKKKKQDIFPMQMASVDALKLDLDQFYFSIRKFRGDSKPKLRLSSKAVV